jgi:hypothetical protein
MKNLIMFLVFTVLFLSTVGCSPRTIEVELSYYDAGVTGYLQIVDLDTGEPFNSDIDISSYIKVSDFGFTLPPSTDWSRVVDTIEIIIPENVVNFSLNGSGPFVYQDHEVYRISHPERND